MTLEKDILDYADRTRGGRSRSQRVNELLRRGIEQEHHERLAAEAAGFFLHVPRAARAEGKAWRALARRSWARE